MAKNLGYSGHDPRSHKRKGFDGEDLACKELTQMGLKIIERNFKSPYGEVDIVVEHKEELIFVEVKCWDSFDIADLEYAIDVKKGIVSLKLPFIFWKKIKDIKIILFVMMYFL